MKMQVKFKKLAENAVIPTYAKDGDAGLDLTATRVISDTKYQIEYGTDIAVEIPSGYVGLIFPRSSIRRFNLTLSNCVGVIDSGYRGEIKFVYNKIKPKDEFYTVGDRIGQLVILPFLRADVTEVNELTQSERGENGFGSTGK